MTKEVIREMYQLLLTEPHAPTVCAKLERIARDALARPDHIPDAKKMVAQPEQEPVAIYQYQMGDGSWIDQAKHSYDYNKRYATNATVRIVYTTLPQRKPLTEELIWEIKQKSYQKYMSRRWVEETDIRSGYYEDVERHTDSPVTFARAIEAAHGIKE